MSLTRVLTGTWQLDDPARVGTGKPVDLDVDAPASAPPATKAHDARAIDSLEYFRRPLHFSTILGMFFGSG